MRMESTGAVQAPEARALKERDLLGGRYRLAALSREDPQTQVWRALDESTHQVVTIELLVVREPAGREGFLTAARRMAAIERPSVMKVVAIHDDADATFVVFQHLVHAPPLADWVKPTAEPPAAAATAQPPVEVRQTEPAVSSWSEPVRVRDVAEPAEPQTPESATDGSRDHGLVALFDAIQAREPAQIDMVILRESAIEVATMIRSYVEHFDFEATVATIREAFAQVDWSGLSSMLAILDGLARRVLSSRPHIAVAIPHAPHVPHVARAPRPLPVRAARVAAPAVAKAPRAPAAPKAPRAPRRLPRVRWGRVAFRGLSLGLIAAVLATVPLETLSSIASQLASNGAQLASQVATNGAQLASSAAQLAASAAQRATAAQSAPALAPATFELPPLSAYGATFASQAAYPTARPDQTVEWVVALRNTGSVGWYRGIDGAQASLVSADGTSGGVQSTAYVGPGQVGWFVVRLHAPSQPGSYEVPLLPRIDGRGALPDLGIYATIIVQPNP